MVIIERYFIMFRLMKFMEVLVILDFSMNQHPMIPGVRIPQQKLPLIIW